MRLVDYKRMGWQNRAHFAVSAQAKCRIPVDHASPNVRGGAPSISLDAAAVVAPIAQ
jgi:hypothetical protein